MANPTNDQYVWPDRLMIRDTKLHDDMGGAGQRIYTTAGQGYEKHEYIRGELVRELLACLRTTSADHWVHLSLLDQAAWLKRSHEAVKALTALEQSKP